MTPTTLAEALATVPTVRALAARLGTFNGAWWDRFADETLAVILALPLERRAAIAAELLDVETLAKALQRTGYEMHPTGAADLATAILAALSSPK